MPTISKVLLLINTLLSLISTFNSWYLIGKFPKNIKTGGIFFLIANCFLLGLSASILIDGPEFYPGVQYISVVTLIIICMFVGSTNFARNVDKILKS